MGDPRKTVFFAKFLRLLLVGLAGGCLAGCQLSVAAWKPRAANQNGADAKKLSLVEIGERSLDLGEQLENQGLLTGALEAYRRAEWALGYLHQLTGTPPLLLDDARESRQRVEAKLPAVPALP